MQTTKRTIVGALLTIAVVTSVAWGVMRVVAEGRRSELLKEHQRVVVARERDWARERVQREITAHEAFRERARRHEQELITAMGGPAEAAAKNPEMGIAESIQRVALACAPGGTRVRVRVERFTEFIALLELPTRLDTRALADLARCILTHSSPYIHRLQFSERGRLLTEIDRQAIESVADWKNVPPTEVQGLLSGADTSENVVAEAKPSTNPRTDPEEEQNLTPEGRLQRQAAETFQTSMDAAHQRLRSALESERQVLDMAGANTLANLQARRELLEQAGTLAQQARIVLEDPAAEYRRILEAARLDAVYVRSAVRTMAQRYDSLRAVTVEVFIKFSADLRSSASLLDALTRHFPNWTYDSQRRRFEFQSPDIKAALDGSELTSRELASAVTQWGRTADELNKPGAGKAR